MSEFEQSVIVITGAAGNLGRAVAQAFAARGAQLALLDLNVEGIEKTVESCQGAASAQAFSCNLVDRVSVESAIGDILERFGRIDVLANIAGGLPWAP